MFKGKLKVLCLLMVLIFFSCGSSPSTNTSSNNNSQISAAETMALAQAALDRMDGKEPASSSGSSNSGSSNTAQTPSSQGPTVNTSRTKPAWVDNVDSVYSRSRYAAAVGYGADRTVAERNALANLVAYFGQSINADSKSRTAYNEAIRNGAVTGWSSSVESENIIQISASMDTLVGAEIKEIWYDSRSVYYAVAALEKAKAVEMYTEMINANQNMIDNLLKMSAAEKNSIEGYTRYQFSAMVADINTSYVNLLRLIDAPAPAGLKQGNDYRLEAQNIVKAIPIGVAVKNDKAGRIQSAFAKSLSGLGFRSGGTNSRYVLQVDVTVSPVELANQQNKFARIELTANFTDTSNRSVLLPYNFNAREGHITMSEAENRTYTAAEKKIGEEYADILSEYLSQILPKK